MFRMLAILIPTQQGFFSVGIEAPSGLLQRSFSNEPAGVSMFYEFAEKSTSTDGAPYSICLVRHGDGEYGSIGISLVIDGLQPSVLSSPAYSEFVGKTKADATSPVTAAKACAATFPFYAKKDF